MAGTDFAGFQGSDPSTAPFDAVRLHLAAHSRANVENVEPELAADGERLHSLNYGSESSTAVADASHDFPLLFM